MIRIKDRECIAMVCQIVNQLVSIKGQISFYESVCVSHVKKVILTSSVHPLERTYEYYWCICPNNRVCVYSRACI